MNEDENYYQLRKKAYTMIWLFVTATVAVYGGIMKYVLDQTANQSGAPILKK